MPGEVAAVPPAVLLINVLVTILIFVLVVRLVLINLLAWLGRERLGRFLGTFNDYVVDATEPILAPIRRMLPDVGFGLDFSPLVAIIAVDVIGRLLTFALLRAF